GVGDLLTLGRHQEDLLGVLAAGVLDDLTQVAGTLGEDLRRGTEHVLDDDLEGSARAHEPRAYFRREGVGAVPGEGDGFGAHLSSLRTRAALPRRNFGQTSSLKGTFGMSPMMRSIVRPIG